LEFFAALSPCRVGIEACPSAHHWSRGLCQRSPSSSNRA
jgi:transposase